MKHWSGIQVEAEGTGITPSLSESVNLLGGLLGHAVRRHLGEDVFEKVETLRLLCKGAYEPGHADRHEAALEVIRSLPMDDIHWLLRTFTAFFHLVNKAEQEEIAAINRRREAESDPESPRGESLMDAVARLKAAGYTRDAVLDTLGRLDIQPTLTAHPTEARRRAILFKQKDIGELMERMRQNDPTPGERENLVAAIYELIALLLVTDEVRAERLTVEAEVEHGLYFCGTSIWETLPRIHRDLEDAIEIYYQDRPADLPAFLTYRSWIGGDRDGNPNVTPAVTERTFRVHRRSVIRLYLKELRALRRDLSLAESLTPESPILTESLRRDAERTALPEEQRHRYASEPFRLKISYMLFRLEGLLAADLDDATAEAKAAAPDYRSDDFRADLAILRDALLEMDLPDIAANRRLRDLIIRARTFGFHTAALDIRQHSNVHEAAVAELMKAAGVHDRYADLSEERRLELLERELANPRPMVPRWVTLSEGTRRTLSSFDIIARQIGRDPDSVGGYIISMTHSVSDLLEVLLLAKESGLWRMEGETVESPLDVVPLLETIDDLSGARGLLDALYHHPVYRRHLAARGDFQEIMLGYSDSNKDGGYWMANWALYTGQRDIADICREHDLDFRIFHGRGGSVGRGGGRANQAILSLPPQSYTGRIRFTEQGEIITFRYASPAIAHRHLEQIVHAMVLAGLQSAEGPPPVLQEQREAAFALMDRVAERSMRAYQELIHHSDFWRWYITITPIEHISHLPIASRPVSRKAADEVDFDGLRAIPWVFAWTQTRYNLPGWYGIGAGLGSVLDEGETETALLHALYGQWSWFRSILDNAQLEMRRIHLTMAYYYAGLGEGGFHDPIEADYGRAAAAIRAITGQDDVLDNAPVLKKSIELRNPYTDVLNLLQVELMRRWREAPKGEREELARALFLSINGVAAAMQSTG